MQAIVAPGQGAQRPGLLAPWLDVPGVRDQLAELSDVARLDLVEIGTQWDADAIRPTEIAQPLVVASSLVTARFLRENGVRPDVVAGHSVGEWVAAVLAGVLTEAEAMRLVCIRGEAMARACAAAPTGMAAVLGGDRESVLDALEANGLIAANDNGGGQIVAGGPIDVLDSFAANPPAGARVRKLEVAGAFHTDAMRPALAPLAAAAAAAESAPAQIPFLSNCDGALFDGEFADGGVSAAGPEIVARLVSQVAAPVRWDLCTETFRELGITSMIELAPAGTLVGLAKRALPGVATVALNCPDDIEKVRAINLTLHEQQHVPLSTPQQVTAGVR